MLKCSSAGVVIVVATRPARLRYELIIIISH